MENPKKSLFKQRFDFQVTTADDVVKRTFEVDASAETIEGVILTTDNDPLLYYRGSQMLKVNEFEYLPEGFESRLLMTGLNVPPADRLLPIGLPAGNGEVVLHYKDTDHPSAPFQPYRVSLYVFSTPKGDE